MKAKDHVIALLGVENQFGGEVQIRGHLGHKM